MEWNCLLTGWITNEDTVVLIRIQVPWEKAGLSQKTPHVPDSSILPPSMTHCSGCFPKCGPGTSTWELPGEACLKWRILHPTSLDPLTQNLGDRGTNYNWHTVKCAYCKYASQWNLRNVYTHVTTIPNKTSITPENVFSALPNHPAPWKQWLFSSLRFFHATGFLRCIHVVTYIHS